MKTQSRFQVLHILKNKDLATYSILMKRFALYSLFLVLLSATAVKAQTDSENPLQPFEFLIGGAWTTPTTYQVFEWGIDEKSVKSRLYFIEDDTLRQVGDLAWFWHPGLQQIRGYGTATDMGIDIFDYNTSFENPKRLLNIFTAFGRKGNGTTQMEALDFIDENHYTWTYYNIIDGEASPAYSFTFERKDKRNDE